MKEIQVVVLAGGKGTRMKSSGHKVLIPLLGFPLLGYILEAVRLSEVDCSPVVTTGCGKKEVESYLNGHYRTVLQDEPRGTGHAVMCCREMVKGTCSSVVVLYGDMPFVFPETIRRRTHNTPRRA